MRQRVNQGRDSGPIVGSLKEATTAQGQLSQRAARTWDRQMMKNNLSRAPSAEKPADYGCHRSYQAASYLLVAELWASPQPYHIRAQRYKKKRDAPYEEKQTYAPGGTHTIPPNADINILTLWPPVAQPCLWRERVTWVQDSMGPSLIRSAHLFPLSSVVSVPNLAWPVTCEHGVRKMALGR